MLTLGKDKKKKMEKMLIDINTTVEDTIRVGPKKRKKNPKERNMIDVKKMTLPASNVE